MNQAKQAGVDLFLGKPVGVSELVQAFATLAPQL
jgi:CheY-like chemotaxis protein